MSRTYREIPDSGFRDYDDRNWRWSAEEKKGRVHNTKTVRDKDNHGCVYSKPSNHKKRNERRHRSQVNDMLNKFVNENYKDNWCYPGRRIGDELLLPLPKQHREYYW